MALALKSNVYSDVYITGNCIVTGTMTTLANPVNSLMTILQDQKAQGTTGGTNGTGWQTRTLNTAVLDQIGVGLTTNQFTLPAGTYHVQISTPACQTNNHRCRLYNVTTSTVILLGTSECAQNSNPSNMSNRSFIDGYFTSAASGSYRIDQYFQTAYTSGGLGMPSLSGGTDVEIYTTVKIIKINSGAALNQWTTGGTSLFYNSGNVGVGTTSPAQINATGSLIHVYDVGTNAATIRVDSTGGTGQARLHLSAGNGATNRASRIDFFNFPTSTTVPTNTLISDYDQNGTNNFDLVNFAGARTFTVKQSGNVGIGTTSPENKLDVTDGSIVVAPTTFGGAANYGIFFRHGFSGSNFYNCSVMAYDHNGDTNPDGISINGYDGVSICTGSNTRQERMRVSQGGLVGIGTATPIKIIHGYAAAGSDEFRLQSTAVTIGMGINAGNNFGFLYNRTNNPLVFGTNDAERMRLSAEGFLNLASVGTFTGVTSFDTIPFDLVTYNLVEITMSVYFSTTNQRILSTQLLDTASTVWSASETGWQVYQAGTSANFSGTGTNIINSNEIIGNAVGGFYSVIRLTGNQGLTQACRNHWDWTTVGCYQGLGASTTFGRATIYNTTWATINRMRFNLSGGTMTGKYSIRHYNN